MLGLEPFPSSIRKVWEAVFRQPLVLQAGAVRTALESHFIVVGLPDDPLPWTVRIVAFVAPVNVPQRKTVSPGPIFPATFGFAQFAAVLKNDAGFVVCDPPLHVRVVPVCET
jgi:hypothetical protein